MRRVEGKAMGTQQLTRNGCWLIGSLNREGKWEGPGCGTTGNGWLIGGY